MFMCVCVSVCEARCKGVSEQKIKSLPILFSHCSLFNQRVELLVERSIYIAIHGNIQEAYDTFQRLVGKLKLGGGGEWR